jgi:hypothetical protein
MRQYQVRFVDDHELPEGVDWAIVRASDDRALCFIKQSRVTPAVLSDAWAAWEESSVDAARVIVMMT